MEAAHCACTEGCSAVDMGVQDTGDAVAGDACDHLVADGKCISRSAAVADAELAVACHGSILSTYNAPGIGCLDCVALLFSALDRQNDTLSKCRQSDNESAGMLSLDELDNCACGNPTIRDAYTEYYACIRDWTAHPGELCADPRISGLCSCASSKASCGDVACPAMSDGDAELCSSDNAPRTSACTCPLRSRQSCSENDDGSLELTRVVYHSQFSTCDSDGQWFEREDPQSALFAGGSCAQLSAEEGGGSIRMTCSEAGKPSWEAFSSSLNCSGDASDQWESACEAECNCHWSPGAALPGDGATISMLGTASSGDECVELAASSHAEMATFYTNGSCFSVTSASGIGAGPPGTVSAYLSSCDFDCDRCREGVRWTMRCTENLTIGAYFFLENDAGGAHCAGEPIAPPSPLFKHALDSDGRPFVSLENLIGSPLRSADDCVQNSAGAYEMLHCSAAGEAPVTFVYASADCTGTPDVNYAQSCTCAADLGIPLQAVPWT